MKKLRCKIHKWLYEYHRKKTLKYFYKMISAGYYIRWLKRAKLSKEEKNYLKHDERDINILLSGLVYTDTDSVKITR